MTYVYVYQTRMIDIDLWQDVGCEPDDVLSRSLTFRCFESAKKSLEDDAHKFEDELNEDVGEDKRPEQSTFEWKEIDKGVEWRCEPSGLDWILVVARTELLD